MFKYGSFKLFLIKFLLGTLLTLFSIFYLGSIISYDQNDPGFQTFTYGAEETIISNFFGIFGSYLSSYSIIIVGDLSLIFGIFIFVEGLKILFGMRFPLLFLRFIANLIGIFLSGIFIFLYSSFSFNAGILTIFISDLITNNFYKNISNEIIIYLSNLIIFLVGVSLIALSFSIKYNFIKKLFSFFKILRFLRYLNIFYPLLSLLKLKNKKKYKKEIVKNEPTIKKNSFFTKRSDFVSKPQSEKKLEIDRFKFTLPSKDILKKPSYANNSNKELSKINNELANKLEKTLAEYGVEGKVTGFKNGPIVTLFEFVPNAGIKSSKIIGLSEDIARAMSSLSARISSQPGKTSMGVEIPNHKRESVLFGDLIDDERYNLDESALTLALGKDISGEKVFADLEKMPHLLIAGTTGSGKSVGINTMILSLLYKFKPNECKLILIDPKMLELSVYEDIPHLLTPVVTNPNKAVFALKWVVREMENRYKLMSSVNVKNITSYNNKVARTISSGRKLYREVQTGIDQDTKMPIIEKREIKLDKMPFIVVVIDEMADLMMVAGKEVESLVQRLAQMARASGIHLITATQRPSVDVITGTIKANFPSRISYKVASKFDSRTILNEMGAEQLLGSGDMLLLENGANIKRLHGGFISESEVEKVVESIKQQATFDYKNEISLEDVNSNNKTFGNDLVSENIDELYNKAVDIIVKQQKVSTSYIQRYLQIGYNRAARIIEKMEEDGIISEANNAGKRHVLKK